MVVPYLPSGLSAFEVHFNLFHAFLYNYEEKQLFLNKT